MTAGNFVSNNAIPYLVYYTTDVGGTYDYGSYTWNGHKHSHVWTGQDFPKVAPTISWTYWREPHWYKPVKSRKAPGKVVKVKGRLHRVRLRQYSGTRKNKEFHTFYKSKWGQWSEPINYQWVHYGVPSDRVHTCTVGLGSIGSALNYIDSNDHLALMGKLRERIAGSDFNAGILVAEGHEALRTIAQGAQRIARALTLVHQGHVLTAARSLITDPKKVRVHKNGLSKIPKSAYHKDIASRWLELQYGWKPILSDVKAAAEFVAKLTNFPMVQTYRVQRVKPLQYNKNALFDDVTSGSVDRLQIVAKLTEVDVAKLSGLTDPAAIVWEKIPYSFVVDWFIPIGSYLAARGLAQSLTGSFCKTISTFEYGRRSGPSWSTGDHTVSNSGGSYVTSSVVIDRTVSAFLTFPTPVHKPLSKVLSWQHAANAVALVSQFFTGKK